LGNQNNNYEDTATKTINKFETHLLSIRAERQEMIHPSSHPTYNERQQKIIEMIDCVLDKYKTTDNIKMTNQENEEQEVIIIEDIQELNKNRKIAINKKQKTVLKDEGLKYSEEEEVLDYILFLIHESTGKLY
jgi:DNA-binding transcriptional MerR regulator